MASAIQRLVAASANRRGKALTIPKVPKPQPMRQEVAVQAQAEEPDEAPSYRAQIERLEPGQSFSRAKRVDGDELTKELLEHYSRSMRMATQPTVYRVAQRTGAHFTIEQGEFRTLSKDVCIVLVVTRMQ